MQTFPYVLDNSNAILMKTDNELDIQQTQIYLTLTNYSWKNILMKLMFVYTVWPTLQRYF